MPESGSSSYSTQRRQAGKPQQAPEPGWNVRYLLFSLDVLTPDVVLRQSLFLARISNIGMVITSQTTPFFGNTLKDRG